MDFAKKVAMWLESLHPQELLLVTLTLLLTVLALWCAATWILAHIHVQTANLIAPPLMRAALIAGLATSVGATAHAQESIINTVNGLKLPDRPISASSSPNAQKTPHIAPQSNYTKHGAIESPPSRQSAAQTPDSAHDPRSTYLVKPGDTLWHIAAHHLDPESSNADIAQQVGRWFETNRAVIGDNPHLIHPGQNLKEPTS